MRSDGSSICRKLQSDPELAAMPVGNPGCVAEHHCQSPIHAGHELLQRNTYVTTGFLSGAACTSTDERPARCESSA